MRQSLTLVVIISLVGTHGLAQSPATEPPSEQTRPRHAESWMELTRMLREDTLTNNWFGFGERLEEHGIAVVLGLTQIYQVNLTGGRAENSWGEAAGLHRREGRYAGSYDLEVEMDLDRLVGLPGALVFIHAEGGWSDGLGDSSVGSVMDVNGDAYGDQVIDVTEFYWQQNLLGDRLRFRLGKLDMTGGFACRHADVAFDNNAFANDETAQFLNAAFVNNPTIPFPDYGLAATMIVEPVEGFYLSAGGADARADVRETGFNTAFHGPDYFFGVFETGVAPVIPAPWGDLPGGYRAGFWYDPRPRQRFRGDGEARNATLKRDDMGFYLSFDQWLYREADGDQGLGAFFRYGWADGEVNDFRCFWSGGLHYQGLIPTRDADVLGIGYANGKRGQNPEFSAPREQVWEFYYNARITPWMHLSPHLQFLINPGLREDVSDAVVLGVRMQILF